MALKFRERKGETPLPDIFKNRGFRSFADMATYADEHGLPDGKYWIFNDKGNNLWTSLKELTRKGSSFYVEGRGNV